MRRYLLAFGIWLALTGGVVLAAGVPGIVGSGVLGVVGGGGGGGAISFDNATDLGNNGSAASPYSHAYTVGSGSNRLLLACFTGDLVTGNDDITSVTYNSVAMTLVGKLTSNINRFTYLYYLLNPASGSNTLTVNYGSTHYILLGAASYAGVGSTSQPDATFATNTVNPSTTLTTSITTATNNSWAMVCGYPPGTAVNGSNTTVRTKDGAFNTWGFWDTNAALTPSGSQSINVQQTSSNVLTSGVTAFHP